MKKNSLILFEEYQENRIEKSREFHEKNFAEKVVDKRVSIC
jgi:hypothetical protein